MSRVKKQILRLIISLTLCMSMMLVPVSAANINDNAVQPCYTHTESIILSISFDKNNVVYCGLSVNLYSSGTGTSGIMTLYDSNGAVLQRWPVSDYESPIAVEHTYQGEYGERYTVTYSGYVYGTGMVMPDQVELSITDTCVDVN